MGIFGLVIVILVALLYVLVGFIYLKFITNNVNLISLSIFLVAGLAGGFLAIVGAVALVSSVIANHFLRRLSM